MKLKSATVDELGYFADLAMSSTESTMTLSQLTTYLKNQCLMTIETKGRSIGFIAYRKVIDEVELDQVVIDESMRRKQFGFRSLLQWHEVMASQGVDKIFLEVRQGNDSAFHLYQRLGYQVIGYRKHYYQIDEQRFDALLMALQL